MDTLFWYRINYSELNKVRFHFISTYITDVMQSSSHYDAEKYKLTVCHTTCNCCLFYWNNNIGNLSKATLINVFLYVQIRFESFSFVIEQRMFSNSQRRIRTAGDFTWNDRGAHTWRYELPVLSRAIGRQLCKNYMVRWYTRRLLYRRRNKINYSTRQLYNHRRYYATSQITVLHS
jgi:hypothetical protein